ncbi:MAG: glycoside hydrolase family 32 protein [Microbacterium sp.]|uniref:family 43 glycosylhydrolase n=1 Tax=Microbacterium sp. TaxID=51671 RepID=UPI0039E578F8
MRQQTSVKPAGGWVGDVIPWQEDGVFHLFYLHEVRSTPKPGTGWHVLRTTDLVRFEEGGVALAAGADDAPDFNAYTGSVVKDAHGVHHLFYTGQNPRRLGDDGLPLQIVMHATSHDAMASWQRHPEHAFGATAGYESADWRDPFVFWDDDRRVWRMLVAARHSSGPERRRGVIAQCVSTDLERWEAAEPFWDPRRYIAHECPEVFTWGEWWYLVYSEFSDAFATRYRMSRSVDGPWIAPPRDTLDGRAFYAAKSAERDGRRLFFGWIATREGARDDGPWEWAGTLAVLEARQEPDGTLAFQLTGELLASFEGDERTPAFPAALDAGGRHEVVMDDRELTGAFHASVRFEVGEDSREFGLLVRASADGDHGYAIRLEPERGRMVFDRWPRARTGDAQWQVSGDVPYVIELERPCDLSPGHHVLDVVVDGDVCIANLDRSVTLSNRIYDHVAGRVGVFATEGSVGIASARIRTRSSQD